MAGGVQRRGGKKGRKIGRSKRGTPHSYSGCVERKRDHVRRSNGAEFLARWIPRGQRPAKSLLKKVA